jgi:glycerol-3-phosphate acyltransferase PlsY
METESVGVINSFGHGFIFDFMVAFLAGYLCGSIPFGLLLTKWAGLGDIRNIGSGNIGATNVLRTGRRGLAAATLVLDGAKGAAVVLIARLILEVPDTLVLTAGAMAVIGHSFPVWLRFRGGKGVATTLGTLIAAAWPVGVAACAVWLGVFLLRRISSLAALSALGSSPVLAWGLAGSQEAWFATCLAALVFVRHKDNLQRLWRGEEKSVRL